MKRSAAILFAILPLTWSVGTMDSTRLAVRIAPLPQYDTLRIIPCLPGGVYTIAAWSQDSLWHGIEGTFKICPRGDLNGDGIVNAIDVVMVSNMVYRGIR